MNLNIIEVSNEHLDELIKVGIDTLKDHFSHIWTVEGMNCYAESQFNIPKLEVEIKDKNTKYFLIVVEEKTTGLLKLKKNQVLPTPNFESGLELEKIYFLKNFVNMGLGKIMLDFAINQAKNLNEKNVWLSVLKTNTGAKRFYEKYGFQVVGELEWSTDTVKPDMWVMKYKL
jgi:ribosomal protein S18 acetylase RimI-like enzyme